MSYSHKEYSVTDKYFDYIKPALTEVIRVSEEMSFDFIVVGATARDFLIRCVFQANIALLATKDIDFAIMINDWERYEQITQRMINEYGFIKTREKQKLKYQNIEVDIIPFGNISVGDYIYWPPEGLLRMSVKGFDEAYKTGITIKYDELRFRILSLLGLFITKLIAWNERKYTKKTDAEDIGTLLYNYNEFYPDDLYDNYSHLVNDANYNYRMAGVTILGKRLKSFLSKHPQLYSDILAILHQEVKDEDDSKLAHFLGGSESYETNLEVLKTLVKELS